MDTWKVGRELSYSTTAMGTSTIISQLCKTSGLDLTKTLIQVRAKRLMYKTYKEFMTDRASMFRGIMGVCKNLMLQEQRRKQVAFWLQSNQTIQMATSSTLEEDKQVKNLIT